MNNELIGFIAGIFVAISVLPQVIKSWRTKSTRDVSILWSLINLVGQALWIFYGVRIQSYSLVIMSSLTLILNVSMIILKVRFG
jgi:MtN3 and saliva related transmembrane protein